MTSLSAKRAVLSVQEHALTDVRLHITFGSLCKFSGTVAKRTIRIGDIDQTLACANWAFLNVRLGHLPYVESTIIYALSSSSKVYWSFITNRPALALHKIGTCYVQNGSLRGLSKDAHCINSSR